MKQYIVDAFTNQVFSGNQAAVIVLDEWLDEAVMHKLGRENNLSATAIAVGKNGKYTVRYFTPSGEINLCGHATMGTAYTLFNFYETSANILYFQTAVGELIIRREGDRIELNLPEFELQSYPITEELVNVLGVRPEEAYMGRDLLCILNSHDDVTSFEPDALAILGLEGQLLHISAKADDAYDIISRTFGPKFNVIEDPVCGSGHCHIAPYWFEKLEKSELKAYQASDRGGEMICKKNKDNRVTLSGQAVLFAISEIFVK